MKNDTDNSIVRQAEYERLKERLEHETAARRKAEEQAALLTEKISSLGRTVCSFETNMKERIRFDMLLSEISSHFINLPVDQVDAEIEDAQRRVCECLNLDLSALWQWDDSKPGDLVMTHLYRPLGGPPVPDRMEASEQYPWALEQVFAKKLVVFSSMAEVPAEASVDLEMWNHYGIKTTLSIPLVSGNDAPFGSVSFHDQQKESREWSDTIVKRLQLVAQIFAGAIARKKTDIALKKHRERLKLATDAAEVGLWDMGVENETVWVTPKTRDLFRFDADQALSYRSFFDKIHPDDRAPVHQAVRESIRTGLPFRVYYRILLPDGTIRWICSRGNRRYGSENTSMRMMGISVDYTEYKQMEEQIQNQLQEIDSLKRKLENENICLQSEIKLLSEHGKIVGQSIAMKHILEEARQVSQTDSTVLILGETGTGKEILARAIHNMSGLKGRTMVTINCASLPPSLIESELFGREKGAYTGALTKMIGRFELADNSTLFLDEIGELPIETQGKLLRVLEHGVFERLGSTTPVHVNVRIIAATNRNLEIEVEKGNFRRDLYYRLNVFPINIPPLRERPEDIPLLIWHFVKEFKTRMGKDIELIPRKAMTALQSYAWPGNVRELRNVIENAMILSKNSSLTVDLDRFKSREKTNIKNLEELERHHIVSVLEKTGWQVGGQSGAAEILGLKRSTLYSKMKKLRISRPQG